MKMPSVMSRQHDFSRSPQAVIPRASFDRSHGYKTTFNAGLLIPFFVDEVLPGDTHNLRATLFARFATLLFPIMDNMYLDTFFFFVPNRLLWDHWEHFNGYQRNPGDSTDYTIPTITSANTTDFDQGTIYDYMGIATKKANVEINALPLRAYNLIINDWFRDENLQNSVTTNVDDGPDAPSDYALFRRGKRYDYFTSSLPFPQKGTAVELPLGSIAPVVPDYTPPGVGGGIPYFYAETVDNTPTSLQVLGTSNTVAFDRAALPHNSPVQWAPTTGLMVDLSDATSASINAIRQAFQIQRMYERDARGGTRYTEILRSHFGVISPDARLQRPEYLGGGSTPVNINPVANTAGVSGGNPQGTLSAFATVAAHGHGFVKSFVEHGYIIGLLAVRADLTYQQGTHRLWNRQTRFDFYWPAFSHLGEQAVLMKEIYTLGTSADANVWGYQEAWADYRYKPSMITSLFRSNATGTLDAWHLSQNLSTPALNDAFIQENPPTTRVKATSGDPDFILDAYIKLRSARPMPMYSVPGFIDHF